MLARAVSGQWFVLSGSLHRPHLVAAEHVDVHELDPAVEDRDAEEGQHGEVDGAEIPRVVLGEGHAGHHTELLKMKLKLKLEK